LVRPPGRRGRRDRARARARRPGDLQRRRRRARAGAGGAARAGGLARSQAAAPRPRVARPPGRGRARCADGHPGPRRLQRESEARARLDAALPQLAAGVLRRLRPGPAAPRGGDAGPRVGPGSHRPLSGARLPAARAGPPAAPWSGDERLEARVAANRREVVVARGQLLVRGPGGERLLEVLERGVGTLEQALEAGDVVEDHRVARVVLERLVADRQRGLPVLLAVETEELGDRLARARTERLTGRSADREDDRVVHGRDGRPLGGRVADEDHAAVRSVHLVTVDGERAPAGDDDVQLFVPARAGAELVVLADQAAARLRLVDRRRA